MSWIRVSISILFLAGCAALQHQNLNGPGWYRVKPTDTLYSIAWRYGLDFQELALWNDISEPFSVNPGQQLVLIKPVNLPTKSVQDGKLVTEAEKNPSVIVKPLTPSYKQTIYWRWPTQGKVINLFSINDLDSRGIDIAGEIMFFNRVNGKSDWLGFGHKLIFRT